jgi:hypothetical protein
MVWQLLKVRKLHRTPLILVGTMWRGLAADSARTDMLRPGCPWPTPRI